MMLKPYYYSGYYVIGSIKMVIEIHEINRMYNIETKEDIIVITKDEFLDLYRQMTKIMVDEVVRDYDPDKPRKGFGSQEPHKQKQVILGDKGFGPMPTGKLASSD